MKYFFNKMYSWMSLYIFTQVYLECISKKIYELYQRSFIYNT